MEHGILVPLDGTPLAETALPVAIQLARRDEVPLHLVTVWTREVFGFLADRDREPRDRIKEAERRLYMERILTRVRKVAGVEVGAQTLQGHPAEVLPPLPRSLGVDLVVMATHGKGALRRIWLGSVADEMARKSTAPVLFVHPNDEDVEEVSLEPPGALRRVLVLLDGSDAAERALDRSVLLGRGGPIEITLLHVVSFPPVPPLPGIDVTHTPDGELLRAERKGAEAYLAHVAESLEPWHCFVKPVVLDAVSTRRGIVEYAESEQVDLIAMTSRGRGGTARLLLGSVASSVVRAAPAPVLLFRPDQPVAPVRPHTRVGAAAETP